MEELEDLPETEDVERKPEDTVDIPSPGNQVGRPAGSSTPPKDDRPVETPEMPGLSREELERIRGRRRSHDMGPFPRKGRYLA